MGKFNVMRTKRIKMINTLGKLLKMSSERLKTYLIRLSIIKGGEGWGNLPLEVPEYFSLSFMSSI